MVPDGAIVGIEVWAFVVGALMPPLVAVVQQPRWPNWVRFAVSLGSSLIAAVITTGLTHGWHIDPHLVANAFVILTEAQIFYNRFWKPSGIAPAIEAKTSGGEPDTAHPTSISGEPRHVHRGPHDV